jgi:hypothetical protein
MRIHAIVGERTNEIIMQPSSLQGYLWMGGNPFHESDCKCQKPVSCNTKIMLFSPCWFVNKISFSAHANFRCPDDAIFAGLRVLQWQYRLFGALPLVVLPQISFGDSHWALFPFDLNIVRALLQLRIPLARHAMQFNALARDLAMLVISKGIRSFGRPSS